MKVKFDEVGALIVEGEDATEWLALRTWADGWCNGSVPLWVMTKEREVVSHENGTWNKLVSNSRQLFRG